MQDTFEVNNVGLHFEQMNWIYHILGSLLLPLILFSSTNARKCCNADCNSKDFYFYM